MAFDDILETSTDADNLLAQAIKRREYNRRYQAKLRKTSKLLTLEKRIDGNLDHVIGYIKKRYSKEYESYIEPVKKVVFSNPAFDSWVVVSANEYKSIDYAYGVSGLGGSMKLKEFTTLFEQYYGENDSGGYTKY